MSKDRQHPDKRDSVFTETSAGPMTHKAHTKDVKEWFYDTSRRLDPKEVLLLYEKAFTTLTRFCENPLGAMVLNAVLNRILYNAIERYPSLARLNVIPTGFDFTHLKKRTSPAQEKGTIEGLQFLMIEFLSTIDRLSGGILREGAYDELMKVVSDPKTTNARNQKGKSHEK